MAITIPETELIEIKRICDKIRDEYRQIRHVGCYDFLGKILSDSPKENLVPLEGIEEMHILNGTVASTLALWKSSDHLIGKLQAFIMIREKIVALIAPRGDMSSYFLAVFEKETPISVIDAVLSKVTNEDKRRSTGS